MLKKDTISSKKLDAKGLAILYFSYLAKLKNRAVLFVINSSSVKAITGVDVQTEYKKNVNVNFGLSYNPHKNTENRFERGKFSLIIVLTNGIRKRCSPIKISRKDFVQILSIIFYRDNHSKFVLRNYFNDNKMAFDGTDKLREYLSD